MLEYNGGRVEKEIVAWVNKKSGPGFQTVTTKEELLTLQEGQESFVLGAFASLDSDAAKSFITLAADSDDQVLRGTFLGMFFASLLCSDSSNSYGFELSYNLHYLLLHI